MKAIEKAIRYVRDNKTWSDAADAVALEQLGKRLPLPERIGNAIHDLMEEWSADNDMPEGWWYNEMDETDIFYEL